MPNRFLLDSNVLLYAYDDSEPDKQARARELLEEAHRRRAGVLSTQVLGEFFRVATRPRRPLLTPEEAAVRLEVLTATWEVQSIAVEIVLQAARAARLHRLNFWDAQIWATAHLNGIPIVLSEDFQDGRVLEGVRFLNPFTPAFDLDRALAFP